MSTQIILKVLALRHRLRQRDHWTRRQLEEYRGRALHRLREHAYALSPFYERFHRRFTGRPLDELPVLTKEMGDLRGTGIGSPGLRLRARSARGKWR